MGHSRELNSYSDDEKELLLTATLGIVTLDLGTEKEALRIRNKLYALRLVVRRTAEARRKEEEKEEKRRFITVNMQHPLVLKAEEVLGISIMMRGSILKIGRGAATLETDSLIRNAMKVAGLATAEEKKKAAFQQMGERLAQVAIGEATEKKEVVLLTTMEEFQGELNFLGGEKTTGDGIGGYGITPLGQPTTKKDDSKPEKG